MATARSTGSIICRPWPPGKKPDLARDGEGIVGSVRTDAVGNAAIQRLTIEE
jgi:hypothetical protein